MATEDFAGFTSKLPEDRECITLESESDIGLHVARWNPDAFRSFEEFVHFTFCFSSALQPYISDPNRSDLAEWFVPDEAGHHRAAQLLIANPTANVEVRNWMLRYYPSIAIPWLVSGLHGKLMSLLDGTWPEMSAYDTHGYYTVFAAAQV